MDLCLITCFENVHIKMETLELNRTNSWNVAKILRKPRTHTQTNGLLGDNLYEFEGRCNITIFSANIASDTAENRPPKDKKILFPPRVVNDPNKLPSICDQLRQSGFCTGSSPVDCTQKKAKAMDEFGWASACFVQPTGRCKRRAVMTGDACNDAPLVMGANSEGQPISP